MYGVLEDVNARLARAYDFTDHKRVVADGADLESEVTGCWSVHTRDNEMGKMMRDFLLENDLRSTNTYSQGNRPNRYCPKAREIRPPRDTCRQRRVIVWDGFSTMFILHASVHEVQHSV